MHVCFHTISLLCNTIFGISLMGNQRLSHSFVSSHDLSESGFIHGMAGYIQEEMEHQFTLFSPEELQSAYVTLPRGTRDIQHCLCVLWSIIPNKDTGCRAFSPSFTRKLKPAVRLHNSFPWISQMFKHNQISQTLPDSHFPPLWQIATVKQRTVERIVKVMGGKRFKVLSSWLFTSVHHPQFLRGL